MKSLTSPIFLMKIITPIILGLAVILGCPRVYAQEKPPKPIIVTVSTLQHLNFGTFIQAGTYGTVTVDHTGSRTATGSVILPNISSVTTPALFEVESIPGTLVTIVNGPDAPLHGSTGGTIMLQIGQSSTGTPFITTGERTNVFIGGTLIINSLATNAAGTYSGTFQVTFIQQ